MGASAEEVLTRNGASGKNLIVCALLSDRMIDPTGTHTKVSYDTYVWVIAPLDEKGRIAAGETWKARVPDNWKICVIDDDEWMCEALKSLLKSVGFEALAFASAEDFLRSNRLPDTRCLILDFRMPGMSGFELHEQLIASDERVPVIFISAHADEEARARALRSGAVDFLVKPFSDAALLHAIDAAMRLQRSP